MNVEAIKKEMRTRYPGVVIKHGTETDGKVTELVGEIDRELIGSETDVAVVVADRSAPHWHDTIQEEYQIIMGGLRVHKNDQFFDLEPGQRIVIEPGTRHWVEGNSTWFFCYSVPDWFPDDMHLVEQ